MGNPFYRGGGDGGAFWDNVIARASSKISLEESLEGNHTI
jgi:hypothetical protein